MIFGWLFEAPDKGTRIAALRPSLYRCFPSMRCVTLSLSTLHVLTAKAACLNIRTGAAMCSAMPGVQ